jgi:multidrug efflux pump subunit AcrB
MVTETFPTIDPKIITITVPYPGATPVDVEEGVTRRVEEAVLGVQGVKRVTSSAVENAGIITVELDDFADGQQALNDVENEVRRLSNFPPADAENFIIVKSQPRGDVMTLAVSGDVPEKILHDWAERIESDLIQLPNISLVDQSGGRIREISLEISVDTLSKYNLTLQDIADKIRQGSLDVPAGIMRTESGEILLRVQERKYYAEDYGNIVIKARNDGTIIRLKDIATLVDGFEDIELKNYYNGKPALFIDIKRSPNQDTITLNNEVKDYLTKLSLPKGMEVNIWKDSTIILKDRINLLVRNAITGFALVFLVLILFLDLKLAFWTSIGIPVSFLGGIMVAHLFGVSLNMITLFALIVVLGIVVDDAIVVGEAVFTEQERGKTKLQAVLDGVNDVAAPVTVGVLTTIGAFAPLVFTTGTFGQILQTIPIVVISVLFVSLLEAFIIFPSHIKHGDKWSMRPLADVRNYCSNGLEKFVENFLYPSVRLAVAYRYLTTVVTIILVFLAITLIQSGQIRITFFPNIESDDINVELIMPIGTPADVTDKHIQNILDKLNQIVAKYDKQKDDLRPVGEDNKPISILKNVSVTIGKIQSRGGPVGGSSQDSGGHVAALEAELLPPGERSTATKKIQEEWQKAVGTIPGAVSLSFDSGLVRRGNDFDYELSHKDNKQLEKAANIMTERIKAIEGVVNVEDSFEKGKQEFVFELKDTGYAAGLTPSYLGQQIRAAYFGAEVQRIQRDQN